MARTKAKPTGRPSTFSDDLAAEIANRLPFADGGLAEVCAADDMPSETTVYRWLAADDHADFREMYARARELAGEVQAGRGLRDALAATDAALGRLRFDARKWTASKLAPKKYGDKLDVAVDGGITVELVNFADSAPRS